MNVESFMPIIQGFLGGAVSAGVFKGPITSLEDWWYVNYGHDISKTASLLRAKNEVDVEKFKEDILKEASTVKPENILEPKINILGPALEASKYYIDEEQMRKMFAKLIASSMDKSKEGFARSSFVEIIKQLTPIDAMNLKTLYDNGGEDVICKLIFRALNGYHLHSSHVIFNEDDISTHGITESSLDNLVRVGLIEIDYSRQLANTFAVQKYNQIQTMPLYQEALTEMETVNIQIRHTTNQSILKEMGGSEYSIDLIKGAYKLTSFGKDFCISCL
ncbi:DUF4393 domain-containing protein [Enterococcus casseliflavus]|uniref:DUF4393 domain-containing protein n=1 Tax=Enterococcus casseliflavus TaxID=37734 RepID=UPI002FDBE6D4